MVLQKGYYMERREKEARPEGNLSGVHQHEDAVLKISMQFFADELLPYLGIEEKVISIAPTELVHLEIQKLYQDFNLIMEDGSWKHFEFQSTNEGLEGLKRFRTYEAMTSYQYKTAVTTYVLYSGTIRNPMTEFKEGVNTYRVIPVIMSDKDAGCLIAELQKKLQKGKMLSKKEIVPLALCPLMGGRMTQKEKIKAAYAIVQKAVSVPAEDIEKIEAVIYAMTDKFLDSVDLEEIMEDISMTKLGQMLMEKGMEKGIEKGVEQGEKKNKLENAKNLMDILEEHVIAERIGLPLETVQKLKEEMGQKA